MASVHLQRGKWYGAFTDAYGKRHLQSTGTTDKAQAQRICQEWEAMAKKRQEPPRVRKSKIFSVRVGVAMATSRALSFPRNCSKEEWGAVGVELDKFISPDAVRFNIGDYVFALRTEIARSMHVTKKKALRRILRNFVGDINRRPKGAGDNFDIEKCALVAQKIPPALRRPGLSWQHHFVVSELEVEARLISSWLEKAEQDALSAVQLKAAISGKRRLA